MPVLSAATVSSESELVYAKVAEDAKAREEQRTAND